MEKGPDSINEFCSTINEDSENEITTIIERAEYTARTRAESIIKAAEEKSTSILEKAASDSDAASRLILSDLNLELRKVALRARGEIIEEAVEKLKTKLTEYRSTTEYGGFLITFAIEGIAVLGETDVVLKVGESDRKIVTDKLLREIRARAKETLGTDIDISLDEKTLKGHSGLHIVSRAGNVLFDNTIESRLDRMADELRLLISRKIFG